MAVVQVHIADYPLVIITYVYVRTSEHRTIRHWRRLWRRA